LKAGIDLRNSCDTGARQRLNEVAFVRCLIGAGIVGSAVNSWWVFLIALAVGPSLAVGNGNIRPAVRRRW